MPLDLGSYISSHNVTSEESRMTRGHQGNWADGTCISFEEECTSHFLFLKLRGQSPPIVMVNAETALGCPLLLNWELLQSALEKNLESERAELTILNKVEQEAS